MPPPELEKAASAGVSAPPQVDVVALVERLREELAGGANGVAADRGRLVAVRHRAERVWAVTAERPLPRRPGLKGLVAHPVKRALRPFLRWYVEPLAAEQRDGLAYLEAMPDGSLGGVFAGQLVEHLPPPALLRLLELSARKLRPGGLLVAETINPLSPLALRAYYADLTHAQPLVPETLVLLAKEAGFRRVETRFLNPPL